VSFDEGGNKSTRQMSPGFEEATALNKRNDGEHLGTDTSRVSTAMPSERLDDWQKGIGCESGRFVGLGVDDGRKLGHVRRLKFQPAI
jgi:hypothetical protein